MARRNVSTSSAAVLTHEGAPGVRFGPLNELRRAVMTCLLWEDTYYESGNEIAKRIETLVPQCSPEDVAQLACEARDRMYLRHVPLLLVRQLAKIKGQGVLVAATLEHIIQRPDELGEYLAIYWGGKTHTLPRRPEPLSAGSKRGLAAAFRKFSAYSLAKYNRSEGITLTDVLRLVHPRPSSPEQADLWKRLVKGTLESPDTWEVALSSGKDKKETFERLLEEEKLGGLAFLRNLRNMTEAGVRSQLIRSRFEGDFKKVLPFRFIAAVRNAPKWAPELNDAMLRAAAGLQKLEGDTVVLVDVSGSMDSPISGKSDLNRIDAASALAVLCREICSHCQVFTFSDHLKEVAAYRGLPLIDGIRDSQPHSRTYLGQAIHAINGLPGSYDRLIVITDEQSHDRVPAPRGKGYMINVAPYQHGVGYADWTRINGWSERILDFIRELETESTTEL